MVNLTSLAQQILKCPKRGNRRIYSEDIKSKVCLAAKEYGQANVAKRLGIGHSLIHRWTKRGSEKIKREDDNLKMDNLILQELPQPPHYKLSKEQEPAIRLTSPSGISLEINTTSGVNLPELIDAFMGSQQ